MKTTLLLFIALFFNTVGLYAQLIDEVKNDEFVLGNFSTLSRFKNELKDVRIISLGESNHSMGTTFEAKVAMIKYLHDSLDFSTIAFESGMYDCDVTNKLMNEDKCDIENFHKSLFSIWHAHELDSLFTFINSSKKSLNPIDHIGIDNQFLDHAYENLITDYKLLEDSLRAYDNSLTLSESFYDILKEEVKYSNYFKKFSIEDTLMFCNSLAKVNKVIDINNLSNNDYYSFWKRTNINLRTDYIRRFYPQGSLRDSMMAHNLITYMNENPTRKVIIWAASSHLMYNTKNIKSNLFNNKQVAGEFLKREYGNDYYFMAFNAYSGNFGSEKGLLSFKIKPSKKKSIEYYIKNNYSKDFGIFSFREMVNISVMNSKSITKARMFGVKEDEMGIHKICDAVFYIKTMHGAKYYKN